MQEEFLKQLYRLLFHRIFDNISQKYLCFSKHILYVKSTVPKEDLLVWQVKDGWKPICEFLEKPVPEGPIPHDNRTGDVKFMNDFSLNIKVTQDGLRKMRNRFRIKSTSA